ncbi:glycosyltransferase family 2 protein [Belnapia sp. F-4-1]|uniref:glycosyltransferase family 2 protein n=1 Tax=Belnapia sp. F-4-1 TaxID=1545443 RepID=UPI0006925217|nr:glycosyltransferase family 2 protein [Belnapia sp. F-4-1]
MPATSSDVAGGASAVLLALSPGAVLLVLRDGLPGIDTGSLSLASAHGPVEPPMSWQTVPGTALSLLLLKPQPGLAMGEWLDAGDDSGGRVRLLPEAGSIADCFGNLAPAALLRVAGFLAARGRRLLRGAEDAALAAACHAVAGLAQAPERGARAAAFCGADALLWSLPRGLAAEAATSYVVSRNRLRQVSHTDQTLILDDRSFEGGFLLPAGAEGPIHLAPAPATLPTLGDLARRQDAAGRGLYRLATTELARRAATEEPARRLLRDHQLVRPTQPAAQVSQPDEPFGGALELAVDDHAGGLFLRGWLRDPLALVARLTLQGRFGEQRLVPEQMVRFPRPDIGKKYAEAPHGGAELKAGFVAYLPRAASRPSAQWRLQVRLSTGDEVALVAPPSITTPLLARDRVLGGIAPVHVTPEIMARCIAPPVERLHQRVMAARQAPEVVRIGRPVAAPAVSLVIPIYRNVFYLRHQLAAFARDASLDEAELIFVLDSPEQREDLEHNLRGYQGIGGRPVTLVVQPANYGYGSACNAGAAEARAPVLLLMNSDVVPARRGWLRPLLGMLEAAPGLAAVGPKLLYGNDSLQHAGLYFERLGGDGDWYNSHYFKGLPRRFPAANEAREVPGITGAAFCVRRSAFEAVGGVTTDYVVGDYEDSDLCLKLRAAGHGIGYVPASELYHFERQSITLHGGYARTLAAAYNRGLHHRRWAGDIAALMEREWPVGSLPDCSEAA